MKQSIRYFAVGLLTSSVILFFAFSFMDESAIKVEDGSSEELIEAVEADGYHVLSSSEYISLSTKATGEEESEEETDDKDDADKKEEKVDKKSKDEKKSKKTKKKSDKKDKKDKDKVHKYTINIKENMLAPTISDLLKQNKIIDNAADFNKYLEDKGYAGYVQLGKHKVNSDMSYKEIAEEIAKKK